MSWASSQATGGPVAGRPVTGAPRRTAPRPALGPVVLHAALTVVVLVVAFSAVTVLAYLTAGPAGSVATFAILQTVVGLLVVIYLLRWRTVAGLRKGIPALPSAAVAGMVAYVVAPASWTGSALFWWQLLDSGPLTFALDLLVWAAAVGLGILWAGTQQQLVVQHTPYG